MKSNRLLTIAALAAALTLNSVSFGVQPDAAKAAKPGTTTIVGLVLAPDGEFDVLQAAVIKAGLADALNGNGQFTVFAPTDAAFTSLFNMDEATLIDTINAFSPADVSWLTDILLYHVVNGRRISTSVIAAPQYETLLGNYLSRDELLAAGIAATDISASNGIIHVINDVLLPF